MSNSSPVCSTKRTSIKVTPLGRSARKVSRVFEPPPGRPGRPHRDVGQITSIHQRYWQILSGKTRATVDGPTLISRRLGHFVSQAIAIRGYEPTLTTCGTFQLPSMIEGAVSLGQYIRSIRTKSPLGAGSQFDSLSAPGDSFWK